MRHTVTPVLVLLLALVLLPIAAPAQAQVCTTGVTGPSTGLFPRALSQNEMYFTRVDPQACGCPGAAQFDTVHVLVNIPASGWHPGGFLTILVSVYGTDWTVPDCPRPNINALLYSQYEWNSPPLAPGDHDLAIPVHFSLDGTEFLGFGAYPVGGWATLLEAEGCRPCITWSNWDGLMDQCVDLPYGNPVIYATGQCAGPVGARGRTWGELKTLYR